MSNIILGIDVGFTHMGIVVVKGSNRIVHYRTVRTEKSGKKRAVRVADDDAERCQLLAAELKDVVQEYNPAAAFVELPTGGAKGARPNRTMGMATAVVVSVLHLHGIPTEWVTPQAVKKITGDRNNVSKGMVQEVVLSEFNWPSSINSVYNWQREHVCDAAGAILAAKGGVLHTLVMNQSSRESEKGD